MVSCCFIGHRKIENESLVKDKLTEVVSRLIERGITIFYFGSHSAFDTLAWNVVTEFKQKHNNIKRVYLRSSYPYVSDSYKDYLLENYEDTYLPNGVENAGRACYVKRNQAMILESDICVFYYNENYLPAKRTISKRWLVELQAKSGTKLAFDFARIKNKEIINIATI